MTIYSLLKHGLGFFIFMLLFYWVRDAIEGRVATWWCRALTYGLEAFLGGIFYGYLQWLLERRHSRQR